MVAYVWCCECGAETNCSKDDFRLGAIFQCPICENVYGCVQSRSGPKVWVKILSEDIEFHGLLKAPKKEC